MPRYFFHFRDGDAFNPDETGLEFATDQHAIAEAKRAIADMVRDAVLEGRDRSPDERLEVVDENGRHVCTVDC